MRRLDLKRNISVILAAMIILVACNPDATPVQSTANDALLRLVNLNFEPTPVTLALNDQKIVQNLDSFSSSGYVAAPSGTRQLMVSFSNNNAVFYSSNVTLNKNGRHSLFISLRNNIVLQYWFPGDVETAGGSAQVRFLHLSQTADTVDFKLRNDSDSTMFMAVAYKNFRDFQPLPAGDYHATVLRRSENIQEIYIATIVLQTDHYYTLFVTDKETLAGHFPVQLFLIDDSADDQPLQELQ